MKLIQDCAKMKQPIPLLGFLVPVAGFGQNYSINGYRVAGSGGASRSQKTGFPGCMLRALCSSVLIGVFALEAPLASARGANQPTVAPRPTRGSPPAVVTIDPLPFSANPTVEEIFRAQVFEEPLVPVGGEPNRAENAALAQALRGYASRSSPDDFSSLTEFLEQNQESVWRVAVLTGLGSEYYNTAHYSLALEAWKQAWTEGQNATTAQGKALVDKAGGELAYLYARLGRMNELEAFLQSVVDRSFVGPASQRIIRSREGLWTMKNRPEIAFRCGPLALCRIKHSVDPDHPVADFVRKSASTQRGCSLSYVAELSQKLGLGYQMAFREKDGAFVVPSVVHWSVGHYAALVRQEGDKYLLEDPTFGNTVWASRRALEEETSGYFLIPPGRLPKGWRAVEASEGQTVWGKGYTGLGEPGALTPRDFKTGPPVCRGMPVPQVHLLTANLSLSDEPVGYSPPLGPAVRFKVRYNSLDGFQPDNAAFSNFGPQWSSDWISFLTDTPSNNMADVYYFDAGGQRTFSGFNTNTQCFAYQQYDQTLLSRTATNPISYTMTWPDGSRMIFAQSDGSIGATRRVFLTQIIDPQSNAVTLTYDGILRLASITDAIGQVTTITHGLPESGAGTAGPCTGTNMVAADPFKITKVTDPFGRSAFFNYSIGAIGYFTCTNSHNQTLTNYIFAYLLSSITDVMGLTSQLGYGASSYVLGFSATNGAVFVTNYTALAALTTPYGTSGFSLVYGNGGSRSAEIAYPDGSRERVEYDEASVVPDAGNLPLPQGMTLSTIQQERNSFFWSRNACATSYGDYTKARLFHWIAQDGYTTLDILLGTKEPSENRVWYDYGGQGGEVAGTNNRPAHIGRVLDDGSTQLYTYSYNGFGKVTSAVDPLGRTFSYIYDTNGIDLLEIHQTRGTNNDLLFKAAYNLQHRPLITIDASGQTNTFTYNAHGQLLTITDAKGETTTYTYDPNGYLLSIDGPLPGTNDTTTATYDGFGRIRTLTDVSGYTATFDYDNFDRVTRITHPDSTFEQFTYDRLDLVQMQDRAGRQTSYQFNSMGELTQMTDPLNRVTGGEWCRCGAFKSLSDPLGRATSWIYDVQGRRIAKQYPDGSQIKFIYENTTSRVKQIIDEKLQTTTFSYNPDNTLQSIGYANASIATPGVQYTYDPNYQRVTSMSDGIGTTVYTYNPITVVSALGAGRLASVQGPLPNSLTTYSYDELGRVAHRSINGVDSALTYDAAGRVTEETNALGAYAYAYDGSSDRLISESFPNGLGTEWIYGNNLQDFTLQQISHTVGVSPVSQFTYGQDVAHGWITSWSQQVGTQPASIFNFAYDAANQLLAATVTNAGTLVNAFGYSYDAAANRLTEQMGTTNSSATYNTLNQLNTSTAGSSSVSNEWDAVNRLVAVNAGNQRTEFTYDGRNRVVGIRQVLNGAEVSHRFLVWSGNRICEEHDTNGAVTKRFFAQGVQYITGTNAGAYYYTRDHLGSIRELTDASGNVRTRYSYDPYGRRTKVSGDLDTDFGFAGMFWSSEANLHLARFRAYDANLGRWLSRDPLNNAEISQGPNLYAYVGNEPIGQRDPSGLGFDTLSANPAVAYAIATGGAVAATAGAALEEAAPEVEAAGAEITQCTEEGAAVLEQVQTGLSEAPAGLYTALQQAAQKVDTLLPEDPALADTLATEDTEIASRIASQNLAWAIEWQNALGGPDFTAIINDIETLRLLMSFKLEHLQRLWDLLNAQY